MDNIILSYASPGSN